MPLCDACTRIGRTWVGISLTEPQNQRLGLLQIIYALTIKGKLAIVLCRICTGIQLRKHTLRENQSITAFSFDRSCIFFILYTKDIDLDYDTKSSFRSVSLVVRTS